MFAQGFNAAAVPQGTEFRVNSFTTNRQRIPAVTMDADGDAVVAWQSLFQDSTNSYGVYAQRYDESNPDTAAPMVGGVFANGQLVTPGQRIGEAISSFAVSFSEDMSIAGGNNGLGSATRAAKAGSNSFTFRARIGGRKLSPGSYRLTLTARDSAKRVSKPKTVGFTVVR